MHHPIRISSSFNHERLSTLDLAEDNRIESNFFAGCPDETLLPPPTTETCQMECVLIRHGGIPAIRLGNRPVSILSMATALGTLTPDCPRLADDCRCRSSIRPERPNHNDVFFFYFILIITIINRQHSQELISFPSLYTSFPFFVAGPTSFIQYKQQACF
jgi:hypothetical protein